MVLVFLISFDLILSRIHSSLCLLIGLHFSSVVTSADRWIRRVYFKGGNDGLDTDR